MKVQFQAAAKINCLFSDNQPFIAQIYTHIMFVACQMVLVLLKWMLPQKKRLQLTLEMSTDNLELVFLHLLDGNMSSTLVIPPQDVSQIL